MLTMVLLFICFGLDRWSQLCYWPIRTAGCCASAGCVWRAGGICWYWGCVVSHDCCNWSWWPGHSECWWEWRWLWRQCDKVYLWLPAWRRIHDLLRPVQVRPHSYVHYTTFHLSLLYLFHLTNCSSLCHVKGKGKGKAEHLYSTLHGTNHSKVLRHGSHSF